MNRLKMEMWTKEEISQFINIYLWPLEITAGFIEQEASSYKYTFIETKSLQVCGVEKTYASYMFLPLFVCL